MSRTANPPSINRTDDEPWIDRNAIQRALRANTVRRASTRRRYIDPTTCERDYTPSEQEFLRAMDEYKQTSGRMFPTWSEVLEVLQGLGYQKPDPAA